MDKNTVKNKALPILFTFIVALALGFYVGRYYERTTVRKTFQSRMQGRLNGGQGRGTYQNRGETQPAQTPIPTTQSN